MILLLLYQYICKLLRRATSHFSRVNEHTFNREITNTRKLHISEIRMNVWDFLFRNIVNSNNLLFQTGWTKGYLGLAFSNTDVPLGELFWIPLFDIDNSIYTHSLWSNGELSPSQFFSRGFCGWGWCRGSLQCGAESWQIKGGIQTISEVVKLKCNDSNWQQNCLQLEKEGKLFHMIATADSQRIQVVIYAYFPRYTA